MLRRIESDDRRHQPHDVALAAPEHVVPAVADSDLDTSLLPRDHPKWARDALTVSLRARELIARLRPVVVHVLTYWDHRLRSISIAGNRIAVDASGSYRRE
jgi:hypothetical protein